MSMKTNKFHEAYNEGMYRALAVAQKAGLAALEEECKYRGIHPWIGRISPGEVINAGREVAKEELEIYGLAFSWIFLKELKLPPTKQAECLAIFHDKICAYRTDKELMKNDMDAIERQQVIAQKTKEKYEAIRKK